jgi:anti-anti-sigma regulatory factor
MRKNAPVLADDLYELVLESGLPNLYLDFSNIGLVEPVILEKVAALDEQLHATGGRTIVLHLNASLRRMFEAAGLAGMTESRAEENMVVGAR